MVIGVGHVAWIRSAAAAGPRIGVCRHTVNINRQGCIGHGIHGIVNDNHMCPLANLVRDLAHDIQAAAAPATPIHPAVPSHPFEACFVSILEARRALEEHPSLPVGARRRIAVIDRTLSGADLVARRIKPRFDGERLVVRWIQRRIPGNFSPGGGIKEFRPIAVPGNCAGKGMHHAGRQIVGGISRRAQTAAVLVDG